MYVTVLVKLDREIETTFARFPSVQQLHCALSHSVICLCVSRLRVRITLSTCTICLYVSTIIDKFSTVIKAFSIDFTNFGTK